MEATMALFDEEPRKAPVSHLVGQDVATLSVDDLTKRIAMLKEEILRLEGELAKRGSVKSAAELLFRR
jgi:uncharacterized small protein (DUF1192 family)